MGMPKGVNNIHRLNLKGCAAVFREHRDHGVQHDASLGQVSASTFYEDISGLQRDLHAASLPSQRHLQGMASHVPGIMGALRNM